MISVSSVFLCFKFFPLTIRNIEMSMAFHSVAVLAKALFSLAANARDAPKRSAELQVLDRFVGTWDPSMQTMTFRGTFSDDSGVKFEYTNRFLDDEHCEASRVIRTASGEVIVKQLQ